MTSCCSARLQWLRGTRWWTRLAVVLWLVAIGAALAYQTIYEFSAAAAAPAQRTWPARTACALDPARPTLLMFVHPRCPCTRASLAELGTLMAHCSGQLSAQALFLQPSGAAANWAQTNLWRTAAAIPGVVPLADIDGVERRRFGARASGEVMLFDPDGKLLFHGGITASRGHAGDNAGRAAIEALVQQQPAAMAATPVFGCALETPGSRPTEMRRDHE